MIPRSNEEKADGLDFVNVIYRWGSIGFASSILCYSDDSLLVNGPLRPKLVAIKPKFKFFFAFSEVKRSF